jgi:hypothetical protein
MSIQSYPFENQATTAPQYSKLFRIALPTGVVVDVNSNIGTSLQCTLGNGIVVNSGSAIINGFFFIKTDNINDNPKLPTENNSYYTVIRLYQSIVAGMENENRAELLNIKQSDLTQTDIGIYDYILASFNYSNGTITNLTDMRTKAQIKPYLIETLDINSKTSGALDINSNRISGNLDINNSRITGTLGIAKGGTGKTSANDAFNALANVNGTKTIKSDNNSSMVISPNQWLWKLSDKERIIFNTGTGTAGNNLLTLDYANDKTSTDVISVRNNNGSNTKEVFRVRIDNDTGQNDETKIWASNWVDGTGTSAVIHSTGNLVKSTSAKKYKENIKNVSIATAKELLKVEPKTYTRKSTKEKEFGVIAEDMEQLKLTELLTYANGQLDGVKYEMMIPLLLKLIKDQETRIQILETKLNHPSRRNGGKK